MQTINASMGGPRCWRRPLPYSLAGMCVALALALPGATSAAAPAGRYRVVALSATPAGNGFINARGQVAFTASDDGVARARFYDGHRVRDLGTLGGPSATVTALNDLGQVTGGASRSADGSVVHAYLWSQASGMVDLGKRGRETRPGPRSTTRDRWPAPRRHLRTTQARAASSGAAQRAC